MQSVAVDSISILFMLLALDLCYYIAKMYVKLHAFDKEFQL